MTEITEVQILVMAFNIFLFCSVIPNGKGPVLKTGDESHYRFESYTLRNMNDSQLLNEAVLMASIQNMFLIRFAYNKDRIKETYYPNMSDLEFKMEFERIRRELSKTIIKLSHEQFAKNVDDHFHELALAHQRGEPPFAFMKRG